MAALSSAFASPGVDGQTIFSPGTPWNQLTGICECTAPKRPPAPAAVRTTSGTLFCSFDRYQYLAAWFTRLSITSGRKSANMTSITGRSPPTALPKAAPAMASSEIGVSNTRSGPCFSCRPPVTANTPPGAATSSPKKITASSRASSSSRASQIASRKSSSATLELRRGLGLREGRVRRRLHDCRHLGVHGLVQLVERAGGHPVAVAEPPPGDDKWVALAPLVELAGAALPAGVAARGAAEPVRERFDELRPPPRTRPRDRLRRGVAHGPDVVAVDRLGPDAERPRPLHYAPGRDLLER